MRYLSPYLFRFRNSVRVEKKRDASDHEMHKFRVKWRCCLDTDVLWSAEVCLLTTLQTYGT